MMLTHQVATPDPSSSEYKSFQTKIKSLAMEIESKVFECAKNNHKALFGNANTSTKVSASTLYNLLDKVKKGRSKTEGHDAERKEN